MLRSLASVSCCWTSAQLSLATSSMMGLGWRAKMGGREGRHCITGGSPPPSITNVAKALDGIIDALRFGTELQWPHVMGRSKAQDGARTLVPLRTAARRAASVWRYRPDIPGSCPYR